MLCVYVLVCVCVRAPVWFKSVKMVRTFSLCHFGNCLLTKVKDLLTKVDRLPDMQ